MSQRHTRTQIVGFALVMVFVAAACGQKPGVATGGILPPGAEVNAQGQIVDAETGEVLGTVDGGLGSTTGGDLGGGTAIGGTTSGGTTSGGTTSGGTTSGGTTSGGTTSGGTTSGGTTTGSTSTGVSGDTIKIGNHAPLTGAAPVPSGSAEKGSKLLWEWMKRNKENVNGRNVEAILKNDNYNPSQAVAVCKEMVEKDEVFLLSGLAGTDQIQACARYAASVGVPYLSAGVTETGVTGLANYFTTSMTYNDQGPLLADMIVSNLGGKGEKNGMLRFDTPNFQDAHDGFIQGMQKAGADVVYDRAVSKGAGQTEAQTVIQEMRAAGIENIYVLTSPVWFLQLLKAADTQQFHPQWVGVGITMTFDTVANVGCKGAGVLDGAKFFAPFPAWVDRGKFDPEYDKAMGDVYGGTGDDFVWLGWAASKQLRGLLESAGKNLTRESFIASTEKVRNLKTGILPTLNFAPNDHFGANEVHVNEAKCSDSRWHTVQSFVSDF
ncbi:MAG TPA: ABC transporter substrate-binding protein [Actinomycetota bacterium]|nr:ABC transporter substrate-binding protein [Actinomycetota bacterium]